LKQLKNNRQFVTLITKYGIYNNVMIQDVDVPDSFYTQHGARASISLREVITADVLTVQTSILPQITDVTNRGQVPPQPVPPRLFDTVVNFIPQAINTLNVIGGLF
jgi:hypothetical protein